MVKSGDRGNKGGSEKERLCHSKKWETLDSVKLSKSSSWDRIVDPSVFSYSLKGLRLQIKTEDCAYTMSVGFVKLCKAILHDPGVPTPLF